MCSTRAVGGWSAEAGLGLAAAGATAGGATAGVEAAHAFLQPNDEMLRGPGAFADKIEPPDGADAQTRLLCFVGRRP